MFIAGGYEKALLAAQAHQCRAVQLFTKSSNQWKAKELTAEEIRTFRRTLRQTGLKQTLAHDCYLINLASPDEQLYRR
jgi:deoxyribonuclease-4